MSCRPLATSFELSASGNRNMHDCTGMGEEEREERRGEDRGEERRRGEAPGLARNAQAVLVFVSKVNYKCIKLHSKQ